MAEKEVKVIVSGDASGAEAALKKAGKAAEDMSSAVSKAGSGSGLDALNEKARQATAGIGGLNTAFEALKGAAALGAIAGVISQIKDMGVAAVMAAAQMKQYEIAFSTMLKSAEKGKAMLQDLRDFAERTPFDVPGVVTAGQQLVAFGFEAQQIIPMLTTLGDAAAGLGKKAEGVKLMAYALGQIKTSGSLKTQDMMQLTSAGIVAWDMLAEASGKSVAEIKDMTEKGMIDSMKAIEVITAGMQDNYAGMMEKTAQEVGGLTSNISESIGNFVADMGQYMTDSFGLKDILKGISEAVGEMSTAFKVAKDSGKSFGEALISAVPAPVLIALGTIVALIGGTLVGACVVAAGAIGSVITAIAAVAAPIVALGAGISAFLVVSETARNVVSAVFEAIKDVIGTVITIVGDLVDIFTSSNKSFMDSYLEAIGYVIGLFARLGENIWEAMGNAFNAVAEFVSESVDEVIKLITAGSESGDDFVDIMANMAERAVNSIVDWFNGLPSKLAGIFNSIQAGFSLSSEGGSLGMKGWMSSGNSDDYDQMSENFNPYTGEKTSNIKKGSFDLSGSGGTTGTTKSAGGSGTKSFERVEQEINRVKEAIANAADKTLDLQSKFTDLGDSIALSGKHGADAVFAQLENEKNQRLKMIDETLKAQENAIKEAVKLRESAEKTGNAAAIEAAKALETERNNLYTQSFTEAADLRSAIEQQAAEKSMTLETALNAAKAEANYQMLQATAEQYMEFLESKAIADLAALETEQALRQQLFDWQMESQQTLLDFALQAAESMKNQLASGIADVITEGKSFGKMLKDLAKSILNMFIQWGVGRALASAMNKIFAAKDSAVLAAQAAKDLAILTPPAILNESLHPGSIERASLIVGAISAAGAVASFPSGDAPAANISSASSNFVSNSLNGAGTFNNSIGSYSDSGNLIGSAGGGVSMTQTNYFRDINNAGDFDRIIEGLNNSAAGAIRGG